MEAELRGGGRRPWQERVLVSAAKLVGLAVAHVPAANPGVDRFHSEALIGLGREVFPALAGKLILVEP